jgi:hypothetical protein
MGKDRLFSKNTGDPKRDAQDDSPHPSYFVEIYNDKNAAVSAVSYAINGSPLLLRFLNIRLTDYYYLPELSLAKERLEKRKFPIYAGAHLAEGADPEWNWSFMPLIGQEG